MFKLGCCLEADAMVKWLYKKKRRKTMLLRPSIKKEALKLLVYSKFITLRLKDGSVSGNSYQPWRVQ
tara:strand:+ start:1041 stop:1241 length:201 start_codon:yes stop_codon:yes gene_type:complete